jgi:hypothetical protein
VKETLPEQTGYLARTATDHGDAGGLGWRLGDCKYNVARFVPKDSPWDGHLLDTIVRKKAADARIMLSKLFGGAMGVRI